MGAMLAREEQGRAEVDDLANVDASKIAEVQSEAAASEARMLELARRPHQQSLGSWLFLSVCLCVCLPLSLPWKIPSKSGL